MVIIVDRHRGCVVAAQHSFGRSTGVHGHSSNLGIADHPGVTEVDVEILIFLKDVIIDNSNCDLYSKRGDECFSTNQNNAVPHCI